MATDLAKLEFMLLNLESELEAGREGRNELYDDENLLRAYRNTVFDLRAAKSREEETRLWARRDAFKKEILLRMKRP